MTDFVDLGGSVLAFAPLDDSREMTVVRGRLALVRDVASRELGRSQRHSYAGLGLLQLAADLVTAIIYARADVDTLALTLRCARRLLVTASEVDLLYGPEEPLEGERR